MSDENIPPARLQIVAYDPAWPAMFEAEAERLRAALGDEPLAIEHIGSTSVRGLGAKPVIDIGILVARLREPEHYAPRLAMCGYVYGVSGADEFRVHFYREPYLPFRCHIHVTQHDSWAMWRHLLFRDYLRAHPDDACAYEALKRAIAARLGGAGGEAYVAAKSDFIEDVVRRAAAERGLRYTRGDAL